MNRPLKVFLSYSHEDEGHLQELQKHLSLLERQGLIQTWHDHQIDAGQDRRGKIDRRLESAGIVLLLVSPSFLASDDCWDVETKRALLRHEEGVARVVPVIVRPCDWTGAPFGKLQALPQNARAVTRWQNQDEAWLDVAQGLRRILSQCRQSADATSAGGGLPREEVSTGSGIISQRNFRAVKQVATLEGHRACALSLACSDGLLASGEGMNTLEILTFGLLRKRQFPILLWDLEQRRQVGELEGHSQCVEALAFCPQSYVLASGDRGGAIKIWDVEGRRQIGILNGHKTWVQGLCFLPESEKQLLLSVSGGEMSSERNIVLWDLSEMNKVTTIAGHRGRITGVDIRRAGDLFATCSWDRTVLVRSLPDQHEVVVLHGHRKNATCVAFSPDGELLASGGDDPVVYVWKTVDWSLHSRLTATSGVNSLSWSQDSSILAGATGVVLTQPGKEKAVILWPIRESGEPHILEGHKSGVNGVVFGAGGRDLASVSMDGTVRLWSLD